VHVPLRTVLVDSPFGLQPSARVIRCQLSTWGGSFLVAPAVLAHTAAAVACAPRPSGRWMGNLSAVADSMAQLNRDMVPGVLRERRGAEQARDGLLKLISTEWQREPANAWVAVRAGCNQATAGVVKQGRRRGEDENTGRSKSACAARDTAL
jgi:hypothetical protein